jgi:hypothetical protein
MPGSHPIRWKNYVMAYSSDEKSVGTYDKETCQQEGLIEIADPFLDEEDWPDDGSPESSETLTPNKDTMIKCPKCKNRNLKLHFIALWD